MPTNPRDRERADFDARFAEIIAQYDDPAADPAALGQALQDLTPPGTEGSERTVEEDPDSAIEKGTGESPSPTPQEPAAPAAEEVPPPADPLKALPQQWRMPTGDPTSAMLEDDGHYEPAPPKPLPAGDLNFWGILGALIGGPLWLLYLFIFDRYASGLWWVLACLTCALGVVLLVMRQPASRAEDDTDDGARL